MDEVYGREWKTKRNGGSGAKGSNTRLGSDWVPVIVTSQLDAFQITKASVVLAILSRGSPALHHDAVDGLWYAWRRWLAVSCVDNVDHLIN
jgi:hypothetical protein